MYDYPVMLGEHRIGPDLADIGARMPDVNWHLRHLYAPQAEVKNSLMPPYRFLFATRKIEEAERRTKMATDRNGELLKQAENLAKENKQLAKEIQDLRETLKSLVAPSEKKKAKDAGSPRL